MNKVERYVLAFVKREMARAGVSMSSVYRCHCGACWSMDSPHVTGACTRCGTAIVIEATAAERADTSSTWFASCGACCGGRDGGTE